MGAYAARPASLYPELVNRVGGWAAAHPREARALLAAPAVATLGGVMLAIAGHWTLGVLVAACFVLPALGWAFVVRPVEVFLCFWGFEVVKQTLAAVAGSGGGISSAGTRLSHLVQQTDDAAMAVFVVLAVGTYALRRAGRLEWLLVGAAGVFFAAGAVSGLLASESLHLLVLGSWLGLKLWTWLLVAAAIPWRRVDLRLAYRVLMIAGVVVVIFGVVDLVFPHQLRAALGTGSIPHQDFRSASAVQSIFPNPGRYSFFTSAMLAVAYGRFLVSRHRGDLVLCVIFFAAALLSERVKGLASLAILIVLLPVLVYGVRRIPVRWAIGAIVIVLVAAVAMLPILLHQISIYGSVANNPRGELYLAALRIAGDNFPFGVGFGRFATYLSLDPYSPVYVQYGLSSVYGLSPQTKFYLLDTSWPAVLGEAGWLGLCAYLAGIGLLASALWGRMRSQILPAVGAVVALGVLVVVIVDSIANNTLFDAAAVATLAVACGPPLAFARAPRSAEANR